MSAYPIRHGTLSGYQTHGCRCDQCRAANAEQGRKSRARRKAIADGTWVQPEKRPSYARPVAERFWAKVDKNGPGGCWLWTASITIAGYGQLNAGRRKPVKMLLAHRVAYELLVGPIPDGLQIDHLCRVRACCNPAHLEPVTQAENLLRGNGWSGRNARKTHCPSGHPYDEANTLWVRIKDTDRYGRQCRQCKRDRWARRSESEAA